MITNTNISPTIQINVERCYECGRYWGLEHGISGTCPVCAQRQIEQARKFTADAERSNISLRGAITRMKTNVLS